MSIPKLQSILVLLAITPAMILEYFIVFMRTQYIYYWFASQYNVTNYMKLDPCGERNGSANPDIGLAIKEVQNSTAKMSTYLSLIIGVIGLFSIPVIGIVSDKFGRKRAILITVFGILLETIIMTLAILLELPLWTFYLSVMPPGLCGHGAQSLLIQLNTCSHDLAVEAARRKAQRRVNVSATGSVVAEGNAQDLKHFRFVLLGIFDGVVVAVFAITYVGIGEALHTWGFNVTMYFILVFGGLVAVSASACPETRHFGVSGAPGAQSHHENPVVEPTNSTYFHKFSYAFSFVNEVVILAGAIALIFWFVVVGEINVVSLYLMNEPFCWNPSNLGLYTGLKDGLSGLFCAVVALLISSRLGFLCKPRLPGPSLPSTNTLSVANVVESLNDSDEAALVETSPTGTPDTEFAVPSCSRDRRFSRLVICVFMGLLLHALNRFCLGIASHLPSPANVNLVIGSSVFVVFTYLAAPLNAIAAASVSHEEQGRLFSMLGFAKSIGSLLGLTTLPVIYRQTLAYSGTTYFLDAMLLTVCAVLALCLIRRRSPEAPSSSQSPAQSYSSS